MERVNPIRRRIDLYRRSKLVITKKMEYKDLSNAVAEDELSPLQFPERQDDLKIKIARLGMVTGSQFGELVVRAKDKSGYTLSTSKAARTYIYRVAWERLLKTGNISNGLGRLNVASASMEHGHEYEQEAIFEYMERTGRVVDYHQKFIEHDNYIGGTPDGYVGRHGLIEVKCPWNGGNHIESLLTGQIYNTDYIYQIQGYLWMTGRKWCDFITYDPDLHESLRLNVIRVKRDEEMIQGIAEVMEMVKLKIDEIMSDKRLRPRSRRGMSRRG